MAKLNPKYDLVIVGYGVVGALAALMAAKKGLKVAIFEALPLETLLVSKAGRLDAEVMRILENLGIRKELEPLLHALEGAQIVDLDNRILFSLTHSTFVGTAPMYAFYQPELQNFLQQKIETTSQIEVFERHRVEAIEQWSGGVKIYANDITKTTYFELGCRFLLACNGKESMVPVQVNLNYNYYNYASYTLNVDTQTSEDFELSRFSTTICGGELPVTLIANSPKQQRWEFLLDFEQVTAYNRPDKINSLLSQFMKQDFKVIGSSLFSFDTRILDKWQSKRVFIAGDAAHLMPSYLGLGLSAGIKDVNNLIWKIAMVAERRADGQLLDYYQGERESDVKHLIRLNMAVKQFFKSKRLLWLRRFLPLIPAAFLKKSLRISTWVRYGLVGIVHKKRGKAILGCHLIGTNGHSIFIDHLLQDQFAILALDANPVDAVSPSELEFLAKIGTHFVKVVSKNQSFMTEPRFTTLAYDQEGFLTTWMQKHKMKYLIVRPDKLIFDAASNEKKLHKSLDLMMRKMPLRILTQEL